MLKRRLLALIAILCLEGTWGGAACSTAANAAGACPANTICFYDSSVSHTYFANREVQDAPVAYECFGLFQGGGAITSFINNNSNYVWIVYTDSNCAANPGLIYAHSAGNMGSPWNNNIRSFTRSNTRG